MKATGPRRARREQRHTQRRPYQQTSNPLLSGPDRRTSEQPVRDAPGVSSRRPAPRQHSARPVGVMPPLRSKQTLLRLVTDTVASRSAVSVVPTQEDRIRSLAREASMEFGWRGTGRAMASSVTWARSGQPDQPLVLIGAHASAPSVAPGTDAFGGQRQSAQVAQGVDSASSGRAEVKQDLPEGGDRAHTATARTAAHQRGTPAHMPTSNPDARKAARR